MRRYWIEKNQIDDLVEVKNITFKDEQFHHIFDVCRQQVGHHFEVITEDSKAYLVEVTSIGKKSASALVKEIREITPLKKPHIHVLLSLPRYSVIDSTIERCVEMGVSSITPFVSDFSFIRKIKELPAGKYERWRKIVVSATQQSGRGELMKLHDLVSFETVMKTINPDEKNWCLLAYEGKSQVSLEEEIQSLESKYASLPDNVFVLVGSEGGFSSNEVNQIESLGLRPVTLGTQILRVETACLTLVAILKYQFDLMK